MAEKKKKGHRRWRNILFGVFVAFICTGIAGFAALLIMINALIGVGEAFGNKCFVDKPAFVEGVARFKFPPSARLIATNCGGMQGWSAYAEFELLPAEVDALLKSSTIETPFTNQLNTAPRYGITQSKAAEIAEMTSFLYAETTSSDWIQEILIDTSNPDLYLVYLQVLAG